MTNRYGTAADIADALNHYNTWRRGANSPAPDPVALGRTIEAAAHTLRELEREVTHWKANHATEVRRARILKERADMPMERVAAYEQWSKDQEELEALRRHAIDSAEVEGISFSVVGGNKYLALCRDGYKKCGLAMQRIEPDGRVTRAWVGEHGMILWPRTECEAGIERAENSDLKRENARLRTAIRTKEEAAGLYLRKYQEVKRRMDELASLDSERAANAQLTAEIERLQCLRFPVELRKMWSGTEVQEWLDEHFAK